MTNKFFRKLFPKFSAKSAGNLGEDIAADFLIDKGYTIIERNFHASRAAEVDIIALKGEVLHFVEVKTRSSDKFGTPYEAITPRKLQLIYKCAMYYIQKVLKKHQRFQIDAISIMLRNDEEPEISLLENVSPF